MSTIKVAEKREYASRRSFRKLTNMVSRRNGPVKGDTSNLNNKSLSCMDVKHGNIKHGDMLQGDIKQIDMKSVI